MRNELLLKENGKAKFTMEIDQKTIEDAKVEVYKRNKDKFAIDGFRKGKAPRSIIEKFYGKEVFLEDAINDVLMVEYPKAIRELNLEVIDMPTMEGLENYDGEKDLVITVTVEVYPEVKVENYTGVEIEKIDGTVTDEELEKEVENYQRRNARKVSVDRPVKDGDTIIFDFDGYVDDVQFDGGKAENYELKIGSGQFIPGFEEQLVGAEKEKELDVKVTFPEEYHAENLAGKEAVFKCLVHEIKEEELPELDDEFAQDISEFDTLAEFKEDLKNKMQERKEASAEAQMREVILEKIADANEIAVPEVMVKDEVKREMENMAFQLQRSGLDMNNFLAMTGKTMEDLAKEMEEDCANKVKLGMILRAIADQEKFEATDEEVEKEFENLANQYQMDLVKVKEIIGEETDKIKSDVVIKKAIDFVFEKANIK